LKLSSPAAWAIGQHAHQNVVSLEDDQVAGFIGGSDVRLGDTQMKCVEQESVVVKDPRGFVLGVSLFQKPSTLKNQIPRHALLSP
jgi:NOL1/NOP2/fmu family ribosome biogenesis protein